MSKPSFTPVRAVVSRIAPLARDVLDDGVIITRHAFEPWVGFLSVRPYSFADECERIRDRATIAEVTAINESIYAEATKIAAHICDALNRNGIKAKVCPNAAMVEFDVSTAPTNR
jgi:hypothetical protein